MLDDWWFRIFRKYFQKTTDVFLFRNDHFPEFWVDSVLTTPTSPGLLLQWKRPVGKLIGKNWQRIFWVLNFESPTSLNIMFPYFSLLFFGEYFFETLGWFATLELWGVCTSNPGSEDRCTVLVIFLNGNLNSKNSWSFIERLECIWCGYWACFFGQISKKYGIKIKGRPLKKTTTVLVKLCLTWRILYALLHHRFF